MSGDDDVNVAEIEALRGGEDEIQMSTFKEVLRSIGMSSIVPSFLQGFQEQLVLPILVIFIQNISSSAEQTGLVVGAYGVGRVLMDLPAGGAVSKFGTKVVIIGAAICEFVAAVLAISATNTYVMSVSRIFSGFGMSLFLLSRTVLVSESVPDEHRGKIMSLLGLIRRLMAFIAPIIAGYVAQYTLPKYVFIVQCILCVVYGVWCAVFIPLDAGRSSKSSRRRTMSSRTGVEEDNITLVNHNEQIQRDEYMPPFEPFKDEEGDAVLVNHAVGQTLINKNDQPYGVTNKMSSHPIVEQTLHSWMYVSLKRQISTYLRTIRLFSWYLAAGGMYCLIVNCTRNSRLLLLPLQATDMGLSDATVATVVGVGWGMDSLFTPLSGWMMDRYGRRFSGVVTGVLMGLAFLILAYICMEYPPLDVQLLTESPPGSTASLVNTSTTSPVTETKSTIAPTSPHEEQTQEILMILLASVALGVANGMSGGIILTISSDIAQLHPSMRGQFLAMFMVIVDMGFIFGPWATGAIASAFGNAWSSVIVALLSFSSSIFLLLFLPETKGLRGSYEVQLQSDDEADD
eukprot:CFRG3932T1